MQLNTFFFGANVMACLVAGLFFLRFFRKTHDRFFVLFAMAFWLLGLSWFLLAIFVNPQNEFRFWFYVFRLLAFILIIVAIWEKNRGVRAPASA